MGGFLAVVLLRATAVAHPARPADPPVVRFEPNQAQVQPRTDFDLQARVDGAVSLAAFQLTITYDPALIELKGITVGDFLGLTGRPVTAFDPVVIAPGKVLYQVVSGPGAPGVSGSGLLATVHFSALAEGSVVVGLPEVLLEDTAEHPMTLTGQSATVDIAVATPPPPPPVLLPIAYQPHR
jgi:hypothetical protein